MCVCVCVDARSTTPESCARAFGRPNEIDLAKIARGDAVKMVHCARLGIQVHVARTTAAAAARWPNIPAAGVRWHTIAFDDCELLWRPACTLSSLIITGSTISPPPPPVCGCVIFEFMQFRFACGRIGFRINSARILGVVVTLFAFVERAGRRADVRVHARSAIDYFVYNERKLCACKRQMWQRTQFMVRARL